MVRGSWPSAHGPCEKSRLTHDGTDPVSSFGQSTIDCQARNTVDILEVESLEESELLRVEDLGRCCGSHLLDDYVGVSDDSPENQHQPLTLERRTYPEPSTCWGAE
jgi:hypothetical protein